MVGTRILNYCKRPLKDVPLYRIAGQHDSGQSMLLFVLFMFVLLLFVGLGIDLGFAYITRAQLSKAVDAACLTGIRAYRSDKIALAEDLAKSSFQANYGTSGRDQVAPSPNVQFNDTIGASHPNVTLDVDASSTINTFFIRILPALLPDGPSWKTLTVNSSAQATRPNLIMSLVLDRSSSMAGNSGMKNLKIAVPQFIDHFDDKLDRASMSSFSCAARVDASMESPFKADIKSKVSAFVPDGWTCSEAGLEKGREQNFNVSIKPKEKVVKVIVFFTDGLANTWQYVFQCGANLGTNNISPDGATWDPDKNCVETTKSCAIPSCLVSINGGCVDTTFNCPEGNRAKGLYAEAEARAEAVARQARLEGNVIYAIGMADPSGTKECGKDPINPAFLLRVANDPNGPDFDDDPKQTQGLALVAGDASQLPAVFSAVADAILARLTK